MPERETRKGLRSGWRVVQGGDEDHGIGLPGKKVGVVGVISKAVDRTPADISFFTLRELGSRNKGGTIPQFYPLGVLNSGTLN